jgi:hypothetical protein
MPTLKSGLDADSQFVIGESAEEFTHLQSEYYNRFAPATPEARFQVDNLIRNEWLLRRYHRVESQLWEYQTMQCDRSSGVQLGEAFSKAGTVFMRLQRRVTAAERAYKDAMTELTRLQELSQPQQTTTEIPQLAPFRTSPPADPAPAVTCPPSPLAGAPPHQRADTINLS